MSCSKTMRNSFDRRLSVRFPLINEILDTETFINGDKKELLTEIIVSEYEKIDLSNFGSGGKVFEELVDKVASFHAKGIKINDERLRYYIKIFVAWVINECDIFNEQIPG